MGYPGHLWSHGIDYSKREAELRAVYTGAPEAAGLIETLGIEYVVVGPLEKAWLGEQHLKLNPALFERYNKVGEQDEYQLYQTPKAKNNNALRVLKSNSSNISGPVSEASRKCRGHLKATSRSVPRVDSLPDNPGSRRDPSCLCIGAQADASR